MNQLETIYIDLAEEITSIIERLKRSHAPQVALVAPKGAILVQSVVNLKLVRKAAIDASKDVVLVTTDASARALAERIGLLTAEHEAEVAATLSSGINQEAIREVSGVRIHRYYEEPEVVPSAATVDTPPTTAEIAPLVPKALTENQADSPSTVTEKSDSQPVQSSDTPITRKPILQDDSGTPEPASVITKSQPDAGTKLPGNADASKNVIPTAKNPKKRLVIAIGIGVFVALIGTAVAAYVFLPLSTITITVKGEEWKENQSIAAAVVTTEIGATGATIPAEAVTSSKRATVTTAATGTKDVGTAATGSATIYNNQESSAQSLPAGSVITANQQRFTTNQAISVPGVTVKNGQIIPGSATVSITAEQVGEAGNMKDVLAQVSSGKLYGVISETSGGTSKKVTVVSNADIQKAKDQVTTLLKEQLTANLAEQLANRSIFSKPDTDVLALAEVSVSAAEGAEATEVIAEQSGTLTRLVIDTFQIERATEAYLASKQEAGSELELKATNTEVVSVDVAAGTAVITNSVTALKRPVITTANLAQQLTGLRFVVAEEKILNLYEGISVSTTINPSWWPIPTLSRHAGSITIITRAE